MKKIEINTSHNIVIEFQLATVGSRILACLLDYTLLGLYAGVIVSVFNFSTVLMYTFLMPVIGFYHLAFEIFNDGQSIGKKLLKIKVISIEGSSPTVLSLFTRWVFRMVDITGSLGTFGIFYISSTKNSQRLGDLLANTAVVMVKQVTTINLDALLELEQVQHEVMFPNVTCYSDKDMLLIKDTLLRMQRHNNKETQKVAVKLGKKICNDLGIREMKLSNQNFLKQILNDYIMLTR